MSFLNIFKGNGIQEMALTKLMEGFKEAGIKFVVCYEGEDGKVKFDQYDQDIVVMSKTDYEQLKTKANDKGI